MKTVIADELWQWSVFRSMWLISTGTEQYFKLLPRLTLQHFSNAGHLFLG